MHEFYKKALLGCFFLVAISSLLGYACLRQSYLQIALLPAAESPLAWQTRPSWEARPGGPGTLLVHEDKQRLRFEFSVSKSVDHAIGAMELHFQDSKGKPIHVDLSRYTSISLVVRCSPANSLTVGIPTYEDSVSTPEQFLHYRTPLAYFSCNDNQSRVELDLTRLETPQWWFNHAKLDLSRQAYKLDKVPKITFGSTFRSPKDILSTVDISVLELKGRDRRYLLLLAGMLVVLWSGFGLWFFRAHTRALIADVKSKLQKDLPFVAYQQLSLEPHRDKEKAAIMQFIATQYANAELDLESVIEHTSVNRNKINDILKSELGLSFSAYLNKLRLTEAARLLAEKDTATVAEIAYSVGYGNVSYFNKLFKEEYGCSPKVFRSACTPPQQSEAPVA